MENSGDQMTLRLSGASICALKTEGTLGQSPRGSRGRLSWSPPVGLLSVIDEIQSAGVVVDIVDLTQAAQYETVLWSITSPIEVERLYRNVAAIGYRKPRGQTIIAGGMSALNPWAAIDLVDVMAFGRTEGQAMAILSGETLENVWRRRDDPHVEGSYCIRQTQALLPGERQVGCPYRCRFCQYTWVRERYVDDMRYVSGALSAEDSWRDIEIETSGRYTTAIDGFSDATRRRVHKPVRDADIIARVREWQGLNLRSAIVLKVYMIVGYPWETPESVMRDIAGFRDVLSRADSGKGGRICMMILCTPFSPEPMTPMERDSVPVVDWGPVIERAGRALYWSDTLEAFTLPQIASHATLSRRIAVNRAGRETPIAEAMAKGGAVDYPREWHGYSHLLPIRQPRDWCATLPQTREGR